MRHTDDRALVVIDTPGLADELVSEAALFTEIGKSIELAGPRGVTAFLLVLSLASRVTEEDVATIESLAALFGPTMFNQTVVVWTHGNALQGTSLEAYLEGASARLRRLLELSKLSVVIENGSDNAGTEASSLVARDILKAAKQAEAFSGGVPYSMVELVDAQEESAARIKLGFSIIGNLGGKKARCELSIVYEADNFSQGVHTEKHPSCVP